MRYHRIAILTCISSVLLLSGCSSQISEVETETEIVTEAITDVETETETKEVLKQNYSSSSQKQTISHYCEVSGCNKEGTRSITGISGQTEYYCQTHYDEMGDMWDDMVNKSSSKNSASSSSGHGYDASDPYYSANDRDGDGKLTDEEFQNAMADALIDMLLYGE